MAMTKRGTIGKRLQKRTSMCSFRIEPQLKEELLAIAKQSSRSLSSLIEEVLKDFWKSQQAELHDRIGPKERRQHWRKEVLLPGRWRLHKGKETIEHDVLIKNISAGGAYTEYLNGHIYKLFEKGQAPSLELAVRLPGLHRPVVIECESVRFHLTRDCLGVGLRYTER